MPPSRARVRAALGGVAALLLSLGLTVGSVSAADAAPANSHRVHVAKPKDTGWKSWMRTDTGWRTVGKDTGW